VSGLDPNVLQHGTKLVMTETLDAMLVLAPFMLEDRFIVALDGPPGCGKTTALTTFLQRRSVERFPITLNPGSSDKDVVRQLYDAVVRRTVASNVRRVDLLAELRTSLASRECLVVIDEAQNASNSALEMIRHLHMDPLAKWHLVIAGVGLQERLAREEKLASRVGHWALFRPLAGDELLSVLKQLHPVLADADDDTLLAVDQVACRGILRQWVKLTSLLRRLTNGQTPTRVNFHAAIAGITGSKVTLPR